MKLDALLRDVPVISVEDPADGASALALEVGAVREDSRAVGPGDVFVAVPGLTVDGHAYIAAAAAAGARVLVCERAVSAVEFPGARVRVASAARSLALLAARSLGDPADSMRLVGVTGTNGKTTTTFLVESILLAAGRRPGVIGTVSYRYGGQVFPANYTTPTALELHRVFAEMKAAGVTDVVMETSSHALALGRLEGLSFAVGAFTNLTQDHLDFHQTMEAYFDAKATLVGRHLRDSDGVGVIFIDGEWGPAMAKAVAGERLLVSLSPGSADVSANDAKLSIDGIDATLSSPLGPLHVRSRLLGRYNLANIAVAAAIGVALGVRAEAIERGVATLDGVPGRVERAELSLGSGAAPLPPQPTVLVDYAHTHDALENVLAALRPLARGRILCVFGAGGDRDNTKRPRMGRVVARDADLAILTSDNPRTEDPQRIIEMVEAGVREIDTPRLGETDLAAAPRGAHVEPDRRHAIRAAILAARPEDIVLIAGKGHEDYQIIGKVKHHFDDREEARAALALRLVDAATVASPSPPR